MNTSKWLVNTNIIYSNHIMAGLIEEVKKRDLGSFYTKKVFFSSNRSEFKNGIQTRVERIQSSRDQFNAISSQTKENYLLAQKIRVLSSQKEEIVRNNS